MQIDAVHRWVLAEKTGKAGTILQFLRRIAGRPAHGIDEPNTTTRAPAPTKWSSRDLLPIACIASARTKKRTIGHFVADYAKECRRRICVLLIPGCLPHHG